MILGNIEGLIDIPELFQSSFSQADDGFLEKYLDQVIEHALSLAKSAPSIQLDHLPTAELETLPNPSISSTVFKEAFEACLAKHDISLSDARTSDHQHLDGVYRFQTPKSYKFAPLLAAKDNFFVFDRERYQEIRGEILGKVRGQDIRPQLAGFSEGFTDWVFETAFYPNEKERLFVIKSSVLSEIQSGWIASAALRWRGSSRRLKTPDEILHIWIPEEGDLEMLSEDKMLTLLKNSESLGANDYIIRELPSLDSAKKQVISRLRQLVGDDHSLRATVGWSWTMMTYVYPNTSMANQY